MALHKSSWFRVVGTAALVVIAIGSCVVVWLLLDRDPEISAPDVSSTPDLVSRGEYLARAADCAACHDSPGGKPFAGGLPFKLPFGTIYSSNITGDREMGIGSWSDDDFVRALHRGVAKDGSHLYPAFPYTSYSGLSREDAVAIKAYLFSLPPVHATPPPNDLAFPFNQRWTMAFWNLAFLDAHRFQNDARLTVEENRGAYLATALGHCGECHTPRNLAFAVSSGKQFAGATLQGWHAYNITPDRITGIGNWTDEQIADYLKLGHAENRGSAAGPMAEAVTNSLRFLTSADVNALVRYLRRVKPQSSEPKSEVSAPPLRSASAEEADDPSDSLGKRLFAANCTGCHLWNGQGRQSAYAALTGSRAVNDPTGSNVTMVLLSGGDLRSVHPGVVMPDFGGGFTDDELAALCNFVIERFGRRRGRVTPDDVHKGRAERSQ
jgi:mono/diheme cytochrome c family protein